MGFNSAFKGLNGMLFNPNRVYYSNPRHAVPIPQNM